MTSSYWKCFCDAYNSPAMWNCGACGKPRPETPVVGCDQEAELHNQIIERLKALGWPYFHSRMDKATGRTWGEPDFIIAAPDGETLWVECKTKTGKQTPEQAGVQRALEKLSHNYYLVRSIAEFEDVMMDTMIGNHA